MSRSNDEQELRDAVVARLRLLVPSARIVHELNMNGQGSYRADVAAVTPSHIVLVELKSKKDKLDRLKHQYEAFSRASHVCIIAAHRKHFIAVDKPHQAPQFGKEYRLNSDVNPRNRVWAFGAEDGFQIEGNWSHKGAEWHLPERWLASTPPSAKHLLDMLWADELRRECSIHRIPVSSRSTIHSMVYDMVHLMTGREAIAAACRQLRLREFTEADEPVVAPRGVAV